MDEVLAVLGRAIGAGRFGQGGKQSGAGEDVIRSNCLCDKPKTAREQRNADAILHHEEIWRKHCQNANMVAVVTESDWGDLHRGSSQMENTGAGRKPKTAPLIFTPRVIRLPPAEYSPRYEHGARRGSTRA